METLRAFAKILDRQILIVAILSLLSTFLSRKLGLITSLPIELIGIAVIFPVVFSISEAYKTRENALNAFAAVKSNGAALYYAHRDWHPRKYGNHPDRAAMLLKRLLVLLDQVLHADEMSEPGPEQEIYQIFSEYSRSIEQIRSAGASNIEIARANQYLAEMIRNFELMINIARYRTPRALRAYSRLFLLVFPVFFGPHFADIGYPNFPILGYLTAVLYSVVLVGLDNVQDHLENPFDGDGPDDLRLDVAELYVQALDVPKES
jgi:hypothetical protein